MSACIDRYLHLFVDADSIVFSLRDMGKDFRSPAVDPVSKILIYLSGQCPDRLFCNIACTQILLSFIFSPVVTSDIASVGWASKRYIKSKTVFIIAP